MSRSSRHGRPLLAGLALVLGAGTAFAIIQALLPLDVIVTESEFILVAKVEKIDAQLPQVVLTVQEDLKGKAPFRRLTVNFKGDAEAKKLDHVPQLLKRLAPDLPLILLGTKREKLHTAFAYSNGTWFQIIGQQTGDDQISWSLTHGEPYLRRTYKGSTAELQKLITDKLAGKGKLPNVNKKEEPGFGPEPGDKAKSSQRRSRLPIFALGVSPRGGPLFGVIPTLGVGAPLFVLAALFPAVFGGVLLLFRQWVAFITVFSFNSTILLVHWFVMDNWPWLLRDSWFGTEAGLWFLMTTVALACTIWAWQRQVTRQTAGNLELDAPPRTELTVLWSLAGAFVLASVLTPLLSWLLTAHYDLRSDLASISMMVLTLGVLAGAAYRTGRAYLTPDAPLATEGVMIAVILFGQLGYTVYRWGGEDLGSVAEAAITSTAVQPAAGLHAPRFDKVRWQFSPPNFSGVILAAPLIYGDEVWVAAARPSFKQGTLYCLNRADGTKKGEFFGRDGDLKQLISSPVIADGRLYVGEGFHEDPRCRLFCVDARDRQQLWAFQTDSQTEASPTVMGGRVYFAAGNDGIYCIDAVKGPDQPPLWRYPPEGYQGRLFRCGSTPAVQGNRLYAGSAVDRNQTKDKGETAIFCLDADTGALVWKKPVTLPAWAGPVLSDGHAFFALGNGDLIDDADAEDKTQKPAGQVLCLAMATGAEDWRYDVPNGVLDKPAVDAQHVYFGCRDGYVYCLGRHDGRLRWKVALDSPVVAAPVLARCPGYTQTANVFAVATAGKVVCLNPDNGDVQWSLALTDKEGMFAATPRILVSRTEGGDRRQLYVAGSIGGLFGRPVVFCLEDFVTVE
jgi:outer membrane protein assembly factor BamB